MANRKVPVTITHRVAGIQPPLFVAGTFSDPQWAPQEMDSTIGSDGEHLFSKEFQVEPSSKIQYKFRVGHGDWWMLNEDAPTVTDEAGNRNNLIEAPLLQDPKPISETIPELSPEPAVEQAAEQVAEPIHSEPKPVQEPTPEPAAEPAAEPVEEPILEATPEPTPEPVEEPISESTPEPTLEPTLEPAPEEAPELNPERALETSSEPVEQPVEEPTAEPAAEPAEEPALEQVPEVAPESTLERTLETSLEPAELIKEPAAKPAAEPISEPVEELAAEPTPEPIFKPVEEPAAEPSSEPVEEPVEPTEELAIEPVEEPAAEPISEPVEELAAEPTPEPISEPIFKPVEEPAAEPVEESAVEPISESFEEPVKTFEESAAELSPELGEEPVEPVEPLEEPVVVPNPELISETISEPIEEPVKTIEEPAAEIISEQVEEPIEPVEEPAPELISETISEPIEEPIEEPVKTIEEPAAEIISEQVEEPLEPVEEPAAETISEQVEEPVEPVEEPAAETISEQFEEPVEPVAEPTPESVERPVVEPIIEPSEPDDIYENGTQNDVDDHEQRLQPNPRVEALKLSDKVERSGTSTPDYARTAAEVADSAAWVDPATPEPEVSDEVAAETGYRQMTSTPPQEAADTAAEVADTAKALDTEQARVPIEIPSPAHKILANVKDDVKDESLDIAGFSNDPDPVPLFAHECAGLYEDDEIPGAKDVEQQTESLNGGLHEHTEEDFGDPTLETFPSNRDEIMTTVRKVESGLNVDETSFEGTPPSPVVRERNPSIVDVLGEAQSSDESPKLTSGPRRLSMPRPGSRESISERSLSAVSLGSIAEGAEEEDIDTDQAEESKAEEIAPVAEHAETADEAIEVAKKAEGDVSLAIGKPALRPVVTVPSPSVQASNNSLLSPVSDEDEAISISNGKDKDKSTEAEHSGYLTPERATTPRPEEPGSPREPVPNATAPIVELDADTVDLVAETEPAVAIPPSPKIVVSKAEEIQPEELPQAASSSSEDGPKDIETPTSSSGETETETRTETAATSSAVEDSQPASLRKRSAPQTSPTDRAGTPGSITETGREAAKNGNWFTAFFRVLFVDWMGGFVSSLCGSRRKT